MYNSFGFTELQVLLVDIPRSGLQVLLSTLIYFADTNAVVSLIIFLAVGFYTRKVPNRRMYIMAAACVPPFVGLLALSLLPNTPQYKWIKWGMYLITVPFVLALFLAWTLIPSTYLSNDRYRRTVEES